MGQFLEKCSLMGGFCNWKCSLMGGSQNRKNHHTQRQKYLMVDQLFHQVILYIPDVLLFLRESNSGASLLYISSFKLNSKYLSFIISYILSRVFPRGVGNGGESRPTWGTWQIWWGWCQFLYGCFCPLYGDLRYFDIYNAQVSESDTFG